MRKIYMAQTEQSAEINITIDPIDQDEETELIDQTAVEQQEQMPIVLLDSRGRKYSEKRQMAMKTARLAAAEKRKLINEKARLYDEIQRAGSVDYEKLSQLVVSKLESSLNSAEKTIKSKKTQTEDLPPAYRQPRETLFF